MRIHDYVGLSAADRAEIERETAGHLSLLDVLRWGARRGGRAGELARVISDVVVQDEYTHDIVVPYGEGLVLVYDTT